MGSSMGSTIRALETRIDVAMAHSSWAWVDDEMHLKSLSCERKQKEMPWMLDARNLKKTIDERIYSKSDAASFAYVSLRTPKFDKRCNDVHGCFMENAATKTENPTLRSRARILTEKMKKVISKLIGEEQNAFIQGRYILDGGLIASETCDYLKKEKKKAFLLKVDFEKPYDSIDWNFIQNEEGLGKAILSHHFFTLWRPKGLNVTLKDAVRNGIFKGVLIGRSDIPISHLQYADDTLIFGEWKESNARNLIRIMACVKQASGLKINVNKTKLYEIRVHSEKVKGLANRIGCLAGKMPFTYLDIPIGLNMKKVDSLKGGNCGEVQEKIRKLEDKDDLVWWKINIDKVGSR
ncbi:hypothetical protein Tco_0365276 [Tanacetum coccineum]